MSLAILLGVHATFVAVGLAGLATVTTPTRVKWYLNGTVNGLLTLVPIAVGVNQIVLSHEFGLIRDLYQRRKDVTESREQVGERIGATLSSSHPATFFGTLLESVSDTARTLQRERSGADDEVLEEASVARAIGDQADSTRARLDGDDPDLFRTFVVMLEYDDTLHFDAVRRFWNEASDHDETAEELPRIEEHFVEVDAARQYLKTLVVERQLARLSRFLIYTVIPAVVVAVIGIFTYRDVAGLGVPHTLLVIAAGALFVATLVPLVVLGAYILRVATIARLTAAYGPFVPESGV